MPKELKNKREAKKKPTMTPKDEVYPIVKTKKSDN
jgi:hypothetical protein